MRATLQLSFNVYTREKKSAQVALFDHSRGYIASFVGHYLAT